MIFDYVIEFYEHVWIKLKTFWQRLCLPKGGHFFIINRTSTYIHFSINGLLLLMSERVIKDYGTYEQGTYD